MAAYVVTYYDRADEWVAQINVNAANEYAATDEHGHRKARKFPRATYFIVDEVLADGSHDYCVTDSVR